MVEDFLESTETVEVFDQIGTFRKKDVSNGTCFTGLLFADVPSALKWLISHSFV